MRNSYRRQFYKLFLKRTIHDFPKIIGVIVLVFFFSAILALGVNYFLRDDSDNIQVAYAYENEQMWFRAGIQYLGKSVNCDFRKMDEEDAMKSLENGDVVAAVIIDDKGEQLNSNFPISSIRFIHYGKPDFINSIFNDMIEAGMTDFIVLNVDRDVVAVSFENYDRSQMRKLEQKLLKYLMHRNRTYDRISYYDSGDIPMLNYYEGVVLSLVVMLSASASMGFNKNEDKRFVSFAHRNGIRRRDVFFAKYLPVICFYLLFTVVIGLIYQLIILESVSLSGIATIFVATTLMLSQIILIHELISDSVISTLTGIMYSLVASFISGNIIPMAFLPSSINRIGDFVPAKYGARILGQMFFGRTHINTVIYGSVFIVVISIAILICNLIGGNRYDAD